MQRRPERISSLTVERGLYVLRYLGSVAGDSPVIFVRSSPGDETSVTVIPFPGDTAGRLSGPGGVMVIVAEEPSTLQITAQATSVTGSLNAELKLEPLKADPAQAQAPAPVERPAPQEPVAPVARTSADVFRPMPVAPTAERRPVVDPRSSAAGLQVLAHVARRGDVVAAEGAWVGGPDAPAPIEGLSLACPAEVGELRFQVLASGENHWSEWLPGGAFGGSRGRAVPLVGVRLRLIPAPGSGASLGGEALFLGSAVVRKEGLDLEFRSAAGLDPLLGLRLECIRDVAARGFRPGAASAAAPPSGRVRVFRASGRRTG